MSLLTKPPNPAEFLEKLGVARGAGAPVSNTLRVLEFQQTVQQALALNGVKGACEKCLEGSPDVQGLVGHGCDVNDIGRVAAASISDSILVLATSGLSKPEQQHQPAESNPTQLAIATMIETLRSYAQNETFVARAVVDQGMDDFALLTDPSADPQKLRDLFARFGEYRARKGTPGELSAIGAFVFDGVVGQGLIEYAKGMLATQMHDVEAVERVSGRKLRPLAEPYRAAIGILSSWARLVRWSSSSCLSKGSWKAWPLARTQSSVYHRGRKTNSSR